MTLPAAEDYFTSCMGTLITSTTFTSFVGQTVGFNNRKFINELVLTNTHATISTLVNIISGGQIILKSQVPAATTIPIRFEGAGMALSLNSGMEMQTVNGGSVGITARGYTKTVLG